MIMKVKAIGLLASIMTLCACGSGQMQQEQVQQYPVIQVNKSSIELQESYSATMKGRQDVEIYPQVSGTISKLCVKEGEQVKKGQPLFVIDQVPYQAALRVATANVRAAEAQVETARLDYDSKQMLFDEEVISEYDLLQAKNALAIAKAGLEQVKAQEINARNDLSYTEVKSPANGVVGTLPYRTGALVGPSMLQPLTIISDTEQMYIYFSMTENDIRGLIRQYGTPTRSSSPCLQSLFVSMTVRNTNRRDVLKPSAASSTRKQEPFRFDASFLTKNVCCSAVESAISFCLNKKRMRLLFRRVLPMKFKIKSLCTR